MKKLLLTLTAVAGLTFASEAQEITGFKSGNIIVEGNLGFNSTDNKSAEVKSSGFNLRPKAGYFVTDKFAVGLGLNFNNDTRDAYGVDTKRVEDSYGAEVFGRYYFLELGSRFKTYAEVAVGFNSGKEKTTTVLGSNTAKFTGFGVNGSIGANYFLTDKVAINFGLGNIIGFNSNKPKDGEATTSFGVNVNQFNNFFDAAQFGLTFKF